MLLNVTQMYPSDRSSARVSKTRYFTGQRCDLLRGLTEAVAEVLRGVHYEKVWLGPISLTRTLSQIDLW